MAGELGAKRLIDIGRLEYLIGDRKRREIARLLVGEGATPREINNKRRQLLKWIDGDGITDANAARLASVIGCDPEDFLVPLPSPALRRLEALRREIDARQAEADRLQRWIADGGEQLPPPSEG